MPSEIVLNPGELLDKYKLIHKIGEGNYGSVWLAHDNNLNRDVAIKVQHLEHRNVGNILQEAQIGNHHEHKYLVKVHSADKIRYKGKKLLVIAMDYYPNGSITKKLNEKGFIPINSGIRYLIDVLKGLEYLHENDLYHNDIKPQNILVSEGDESVLSDYGLACYAPDLVPVLSKYAYILHVAPETITDNKITVQTDIYQFGMTAFRLLNGESKLEDLYEQNGGKDFEKLILSGKLVDSVGYCPFIPLNLQKIISKATHVDPSRRYETAHDMRRALERLNYQGYWTYDYEGNYLGYDGKNKYFFTTESNDNHCYNFFAKKKTKLNKVYNVNLFSKKNVSSNEIEVLKQNFMLFVINGKDSN